MAFCSAPVPEQTAPTDGLLFGCFPTAILFGVFCWAAAGSEAGGGAAPPPPRRGRGQRRWRRTGGGTAPLDRVRFSPYPPLALGEGGGSTSHDWLLGQVGVLTVPARPVRPNGSARPVRKELSGRADRGRAAALWLPLARRSVCRVC